MIEKTGNPQTLKRGSAVFKWTAILGVIGILLIIAADSTMSMLHLKKVVSEKVSRISMLEKELQAASAQEAGLLLRVQSAEKLLAQAKAEFQKVIDPKGELKPLPSPATKYAVEIRPKSPVVVHVRSVFEPDELATQYQELAPALRACDKGGKLGLDLCVLDKNTSTDFMDVLVIWSDEDMKIGEVDKLTRCLKRQPNVKHKDDKTAIDWDIASRYNGSCLPRPDRQL